MPGGQGKRLFVPRSAMYAHLWQHDTFSDVALLLKLAHDSPDGKGRVLKKLPGHRAILSASPYFSAQLERWQDLQPGPSSKRSRSTQKQQHDNKERDTAKHPEVSVLLESEEHETAALAVMAALHGVDTSPEQVTDVQLLQMVLLADMLQVSAVADKAATSLAAAATVPGKGLSDAARQQLLSLEAWPAYLFSSLGSLTKHMELQDTIAVWVKQAAIKSPCDLEAVAAAPHSSYIQKQLLAELGNLENVWSDSSKQTLLGLPLPAMQLLLSSDKLKVACEDTVLYTAQAYITAQQGTRQRSAALQQLAQLVRCAHLSHFWLTAALDPACGQFVLKPLKQQVRALLAFLQVQPRGRYKSDRFKAAVPDAPASWALGPRKLQRAPRSVSVSWQLPVRDLKEACIRAATEKERVTLTAPSVSAPLCGVAFTITAKCRGSSQGTQVGLFVKPHGVPAGIFCGFAKTLAAGGTQHSSKHTISEGSLERGWVNFFNLGHMAGGWDELAWANKGLPTTGELTITATLSKSW